MVAVLLVLKLFFRDCLIDVFCLGGSWTSSTDVSKAISSSIPISLLRVRGEIQSQLANLCDEGLYS